MSQARAGIAARRPGMPQLQSGGIGARARDAGEPAKGRATSEEAQRARSRRTDGVAPGAKHGSVNENGIAWSKRPARQ
eukprot:12627061-Alexandrium_andersonii.AAC.1